MADLNAQLASEITAACQANLADIGAGLSRTIDVELTATLGAAEEFVGSAPPAELSGPGLLVVIRVGSTAMLGALAESSGLLPAWYRAPDPTGQSKLATLAQELGLQVLPDSLLAEDFQAAHVADLAQAITAGRLPEQAVRLPLTLTASDGRSAVFTLLWPASEPAAALSATAPLAEAAAATPSQSASASQSSPAAPTPIPAAASTPTTPPSAEPARHVVGLDGLPSYARSLLRIRVPVTVCLARKRQPVRRIVEIIPGTILQFDKPCEEMLDLEVNGRRIAQGEAVKVGDKFGLRIAMLTPEQEKFVTLRRRGA